MIWPPVDAVAEQARADHRHLARSAGRAARDREREIHEQLAGAALLHERPEQDEQHHIGRGDAERRAEDPLGREVDLLHQHRHAHGGEEQRIREERDRGECHRQAEHAPRRLEHEQGRDHRVKPVERGQLVDVDDAVVDIVDVDEEVQDEGPGAREQRPVERTPAPPPAGLRRIEQEDERHREKQVRAAEEVRLGRAEPPYVHVVERHGHCDDGDGRLQRARRRRGRCDLLVRHPSPSRDNGAAGAAPSPVRRAF